MNKERKKEIKLLSKVAKKDAKAFETLYRLLSHSVFMYLLRLLQNRESAEDILVEVFAVVWKNAGNFKGKSRVKTWIFGIARNQAFNEIRKRKPMNHSIMDKPLEDMDSSKAIIGFETREFIQKAILNLSVKHREILDLVFFHELNYTQISKLLKIPENTVKTRVYYAKASLKKECINIGC